MNSLFHLWTCSAVAGLTLVFSSSCKEAQRSQAPAHAVELKLGEPGKYGWRVFVTTDWDAEYADYNTILHGVSRKQFAQLNAFVETFDETYPSGKTRRQVFYDIFSEYDSINTAQPERYFTQYLDNLEEWRDSEKDDAVKGVAQIARANFLINIAWFHRGGGWAHTVSKSQWAKFTENIELAEMALQEAPIEAKEDPHFYQTLLTVAVASGFDKTETESVMREAVANHPDYLPLYSAYSWYLEKKWHGESETDWHDGLVAALDSATMSAEQKNKIYGVVVRSYMRGAYGEEPASNIYRHYGIDQKRFLSGLGTYAQENSESSRWPDNYLYHAFKARDEAHVIAALKLCDGRYDAKRWKGNSWFEQLDKIAKQYPATRELVYLGR